MERIPLEGHPYHSKTDDELHYIVRDASQAAVAMRGHNPEAEAKYLDQVNDASTILHHRRMGGQMERGTPAQQFVRGFKEPFNRLAKTLQIGQKSGGSMSEGKIEEEMNAPPPQRNPFSDSTDEQLLQNIKAYASYALSNSAFSRVKVGSPDLQKHIEQLNKIKNAATVLHQRVSKEPPHPFNDRTDKELFNIIKDKSFSLHANRNLERGELGNNSNSQDYFQKHLNNLDDVKNASAILQDRMNHPYHKKTDHELLNVINSEVDSARKNHYSPKSEKDVNPVVGLALGVPSLYDAGKQANHLNNVKTASMILLQRMAKMNAVKQNKIEEAMEKGTATKVLKKFQRKTGDVVRHAGGSVDHNQTKSMVNKAMKKMSPEDAAKMTKILRAADKKKGSQVDEEKMSPAEMKKREKIVKGMKKNFGSFREKYGSRAKEVMYATATKQAMEEDTTEPIKIYSDAYGVGVVESWRVETSDATGRHYLVSGYDDKSRKVWKNKSGAGDFFKKADAEEKAKELNKSVKESLAIDEEVQGDSDKDLCVVRFDHGTEILFVEDAKKMFLEYNQMMTPMQSNSEEDEDEDDDKEEGDDVTYADYSGEGEDEDKDEEDEEEEDEEEDEDEDEDEDSSKMKNEQAEVETPPIQIRSFYAKAYAKHGGTIGKSHEAQQKAYKAVSDKHGVQALSDLKKYHEKNMSEALDPVGKEDEDVDNDGDKDKSDSYLMNRRKAIKAALTKKK